MTNHDEGRKCGLCNGDVPSGEKDKHGYGVCCFYDVMVDIETLGTSPNAAIVQIGAVRFDPFMGEQGTISSPEGSFNFHAKLTGSPAIDGDLEWGTVYWWLTQPKEAQQRVFQPATAPRDHIGTGIYKFITWLESMPFKRVWAAGPQFDLALLKRTFDRVSDGMPTFQLLGQPQPGPIRPWPIGYGRERDFRTLKQVGRLMDIPEPVRVGVEHDALDDAFHQAGYAIQVLRRVAVNRETWAVTK